MPRNSSVDYQTLERLDPLDTTKRLVWAQAAGRCTLCNKLVTRNEDLGERGSIAELAHIVGAKPAAARGNSEKTEEERRNPDNFILLCKNCHKPIDASGAEQRFTVEELLKRKIDHEKRIEFVTSIGEERRAHIVRLVSTIRGTPVSLTYNDVLRATTGAGIFPQFLANSHSAEFEIDLRGYNAATTEDYYHFSCTQINAAVERVHSGILQRAITRLAVFAISTIPNLIYLGARLGDKIDTDVFQRHRVTNGASWAWPIESPEPPQFFITREREGRDLEKVALVVWLSGAFPLTDLPAAIDESFYIYSIGPTDPNFLGPDIISSIAALKHFETVSRMFLARMEQEHPELRETHLFPAIPVSAAITLGRVLMPDRSPTWIVHERDDHNQFIRALKVEA